MEDNFAEDTVAIVLTKAATFSFKTYTPEDFPEIEGVRVTDSTDLIMEIVKQQMEAERTGDWSRLQDRIEIGMLVNVENFRRILHLQLPERGKENVLRAIRQLENREEFLYVGPDYYMQLASYPFPYPTYYSWQEQDHQNMSLDSAWEISGGRTYLFVGILDTGVQADHPSLKNMVNIEMSRDFTTGVQHGIPGGVIDENGHGTHVASTCSTNCIGGVAGVNWGTKLVSYQVFDSLGNGAWSWTINAIDYVSHRQVPILNYSGGGHGGFSQSPDEKAALYYAIRNYAGLFICAAGNNSPLSNDNYPFYPSNFTVPYGSFPALNNLVSVAAINKNNM